MPYCSKCGAELRPNAKFCHKCGAKVLPARKERAVEAEKKIFEKGYSFSKCEQKDHNIIYMCPACNHKETVQRTSLSPTDIPIPWINNRRRMMANFFSLILSLAVAIVIGRFVALSSELLSWIAFFALYLISYFILKRVFWVGFGVVEVSMGMASSCPDCGEDVLFITDKSGRYYLVKPLKG